MRHDVEMSPDMEDSTYQIRLKDTRGTLNTTNGRHITFKEDPQLGYAFRQVTCLLVTCLNVFPSHKEPFFFHMWLTLYNKPAQI